MKTTCLYCEREYNTKRDSSLYCTNSCRTSAYKLRKKNAQKEADRQKATQAQKAKDFQQKLIDDEMRKQKAEKRRLAKEEKALNAPPENVSNNGTMDQQDSISNEPEIQTEVEQKQPEPEQKKVGLRTFREIQQEIERKQSMDEIVKNANLKLAGWIVVGGIAYTLLDHILNSPKKGPPV